MYSDLIGFWSTPNIRRDKLSKSFKQLTSLEPAEFLDFYAYLSNELIHYNIALMPFDAVELNYGYVGLCFPGVGERRYLQMTTEAFRVFDYVFPHEEPSVRVASRKHGGQKPDGYRFLWDVMCQTQPVFATFVPNNQPDWHRSNGDILLHAKRWIAYFRFEAKKRSYATDVQKSQLFLRSIHDNTLLSTIKSLEMSIMTQEAQTDSQFLPHHLQIQQLADSLALTKQPLENELTYAPAGNNYQPTDSQLHSQHVSSSPTLHLMQGTFPSINLTDSRRRSDRPSPSDASRDAGSRRSSSSRDSSRRSLDSPRRRRSERGSTHPSERLRTASVVCEACFGRGHEATKCWALARALITGQYIQRNLRSDVLKSVVEAYRDKQQPSHAPRSNNFCRSVLHNYCQETGLSEADVCHQFDWDAWATETTEPLSESEESFSDTDEEDGAASAARP
jgi:hypothetical protein